MKGGGGGNQYSIDLCCGIVTPLPSGNIHCIRNGGRNFGAVIYYGEGGGLKNGKMTGEEI